VVDLVNDAVRRANVGLDDVSVSVYSHAAVRSVNGDTVLLGVNGFQVFPVEQTRGVLGVRDHVVLKDLSEEILV